MAFSISFPNFLCLLLTGVLVVHMLTRGPLINDLPELPEDAEATFCKLPQSLHKIDSEKCSSIRRLFFLLGNDCSFSKRPKQVVEDLSPQNFTEDNETDSVEDDIQENGTEEVVKIELNDGTEVENEKEKEEEPDKEEKTSYLVDSFVITLLICSAIVSLLELYREKTRKLEQGGGIGPGSGEEVVVSNRRMSLADLTVNRHIRRRDSQQHADTLRQTTSGSKPPPLLRRSSFPVQLPETRPRHSFHRQQSHPGVLLPSPSGRRLSMDLSEDDASPDRRRVITCALTLLELWF